MMKGCTSRDLQTRFGTLTHFHAAEKQADQDQYWVLLQTDKNLMCLLVVATPNYQPNTLTWHHHLHAGILQQRAISLEPMTAGYFDCGGRRVNYNVDYDYRVKLRVS